MSIDVLDRPRDATREKDRSETPAQGRGRVYVTPDGRVVIGKPEDPSDRTLSEVHPAVFA
ncbi:MAG TPA: hypothetical protein VFL83_02800 [Anaeromyxobacter sp.]|nr:hypothetical protein [Anaeromyxobacter sp.]